MIGILPISLFTVIGTSMHPAFTHGKRVVVQHWFYSPALQDVVVIKDPRNARLILKRIIEIKNLTYFVVGDNKQESTDSRKFGWIKRKQIIGKVIFPNN